MADGPFWREPERRYTIGELAREFEVTTRTIRHYESKGLLSPERDGIARTYSARDRARLILILRGKNLGFSLEVIRTYLDLYDADPTQMAQLKHLKTMVDERISVLQRKRDDVDRTLRDLKSIRTQVARALRGKGAKGGD